MYNPHTIAVILQFYYQAKDGIRDADVTGVQTCALPILIIGENAKPQDLEVNPLKSKQLTNFRASGKDEGIRLTPPRKMTLEQAIAYIQDDELVRSEERRVGKG